MLELAIIIVCGATVGLIGLCVSIEANDTTGRIDECNIRLYNPLTISAAEYDRMRAVKRKKRSGSAAKRRHCHSFHDDDDHDRRRREEEDYWHYYHHTGSIGHALSDPPHHGHHDIGGIGGGIGHALSDPIHDPACAIHDPTNPFCHDIGGMDHGIGGDSIGGGIGNDRI